MVRSLVANALVFAGAVAVISGAWLAWPPLGCVVLGVCLTMAGIALAGTADAR